MTAQTLLSTHVFDLSDELLTILTNTLNFLLIISYNISVGQNSIFANCTDTMLLIDKCAHKICIHKNYVCPFILNDT